VPKGRHTNGRKSWSAMAERMEVELDIPWKMPDPAWVLTVAEAENFETRLADLRQATQRSLSGNLGYRGSSSRPRQVPPVGSCACPPPNTSSTEGTTAVVDGTKSTYCGPPDSESTAVTELGQRRSYE
jgi:hypothetical protein